MYASGPFTRVCFVLIDGHLELYTPRVHASGERGDLVNTITELNLRGYRRV